MAGVMGYYPIHRAVLLDYDVAKHVIPLLINKGADIDQRALPSGTFGNVPTFEVTPLHITANNTSIDQRITELLLKMGADLTIKDGNGLTPLDTAIKSSNDDAVKLIEKANSQAGGRGQATLAHGLSRNKLQIIRSVGRLRLTTATRRNV